MQIILLMSTRRRWRMEFVRVTTEAYLPLRSSCSPSTLAWPRLGSFARGEEELVECRGEEGDGPEGRCLRKVAWCFKELSLFVQNEEHAQHLRHLRYVATELFYSCLASSSMRIVCCFMLKAYQADACFCGGPPFVIPLQVAPRRPPYGEYLVSRVSFSLRMPDLRGLKLLCWRYSCVVVVELQVCVCKIYLKTYSSVCREVMKDGGSFIVWLSQSQAKEVELRIPLQEESIPTAKEAFVDQGLARVDLQKLPTVECRKGEEGVGNYTTNMKTSTCETQQDMEQHTDGSVKKLYQGQVIPKDFESFA
eukprot:Gb_04250 [translate_table: standard]